MGIFDWIMLGLAIIIFAVGAIFMIHQVFTGLEKTALNDKYLWGVNIQGFYFLSSAGIGILLMIAVALLCFENVVTQESLRTPAAVAFGCLLSSQVLMGSDLGRPFRALRIITGKNFISPLTVDFLVLFLLTVLSFVFMFGIFMHNEIILTIWIWGTMLISFLGMVAHTLLFIPRVGPGYQSEPFQSVLTFGIGGLIGAGMMVIMTRVANFEHLLIIFSLIVAAFSIGVILASILADKRPHNIIFTALIALVLLMLFANKIIFGDSQILATAAATISVVAGYIEKHQTIIHLQIKPVMPEPYSCFERKPKYKPALSEWLNLTSALALVVIVTYGVIILREYIFPWILKILN